jgi:hypothetical protein
MYQDNLYCVQSLSSLTVGDDVPSLGRYEGRFRCVHSAAYGHYAMYTYALSLTCLISAHDEISSPAGKELHCAAHTPFKMKN